LTIGGMAWLAHKLCEEGVPSAQLLVYVHQLNSKLQSAPTMEQCAQQVSLLPERAVLVVLELVASGEPHAHIGATLLHFASFHLPLLTTLLVQTQAISVLVALVRGNAEYELSRSAMSLLVTFGKHKEGARQLGQTRGLCHLIAKMLLHREVEMQWLAVELVRVVLTTAAGRAQACSSPKLQTAIQEAEKDNRLGTDGSRQLGMLQREIRFYQRNLLQSSQRRARTTEETETM